MGKRKPRKRAMRKGYLKRFSAAQMNSGSLANVHLMRDFHGSINGHTAAQPLPKPLGMSSERIAVLGKLANPTETWKNLVLEQAKGYTLRMFFDGDMFFFIRENTSARLVQKSVHYQGRQRAMDRYKRDKIIWIETRSLPPQSP